MWVLLAICSALCLGFYDIAKKKSLNRFSVVSVLTMSVWVSSLLLLPILLCSKWMPQAMEGSLFYVPPISHEAHGFILLKSCIVLSSWVCNYIALKHLPISIVSPMQATRPMWTIIGALLIFGERLSGWQWVGVSLALGSLFLFNLFEHVKSHRHTTSDRRYYIALASAILLGSMSGLYDKFMMQRFDHNAVQVYYTFYQAILMSIVWIIVQRQQGKPVRITLSRPFPWFVVCISVFLVLSDFVYLLALSYPGSLLAIVSTIRRGGAIIPFLYGIIILKEPDPWKKAICTAGITLGLVCLAIHF